MSATRISDTPVGDLHCPDVPASSEYLPPLRHALARWAKQAGLDTAVVEDLVLAMYEAAANVVEHAYPVGGGTLSMSACYFAEPARVEITVADHGAWRPPAPAPAEGDISLRGRGLLIMRRLADHVVVEAGEQGTTVRATWGIAASQQLG